MCRGVLDQSEDRPLRSERPDRSVEVIATAKQAGAGAAARGTASPDQRSATAAAVVPPPKKLQPDATGRWHTALMTGCSRRDRQRGWYRRGG